jgi:N-acetylglutamate synthase-like GNAT family acetyltransferase|tara:strand:+ start:110 stop:505 length:396 start_codon:yes stop_codon:yes gene_type:complete
MKISIKLCDYKEITPLIKHGKKERVTFVNAEGCLWFCAEYEGSVIGCAALVIKGATARFKSDFVHPNFRMGGVGNLLMEARLKELGPFVGKATAFCTPMSWPIYKKNGFIEHNKNKFGIIYSGRLFKHERL